MCTPCMIRISVWNCVDVKRPIVNFIILITHNPYTIREVFSTYFTFIALSIYQAKVFFFNDISLYRNIIQQFPYTIPNKASVEIARDVPRTSDHVDEEVLETLLHQYVQILPCDGYLQGFNYIIHILYHVFSKDDQEHATADTWWAATTVIGIIRPMIPDHDPDDYARYTRRWGKHYIKYIQIHSPRTHAWLTPFYDSLLPTLTVKWLMIWFTQLFDIDNCFASPNAEIP